MGIIKEKQKQNQGTGGKDGGRRLEGRRGVAKHSKSPPKGHAAEKAQLVKLTFMIQVFFADCRVGPRDRARSKERARGVGIHPGLMEIDNNPVKLRRRKVLPQARPDLSVNSYYAATGRTLWSPGRVQWTPLLLCATPHRTTGKSQAKPRAKRAPWRPWLKLR